MATVEKLTRGAVGTNNWTNPANATADDATYATAAPAKNNSVIGDWDYAAFSDADIPVGSVIDSVTCRVEYHVDTQASVASLGINNGNNAVFDGETTQTTEPLADATFDDAYNTIPSETDLKTAGRLVSRVRGIRGNSNTAVTFSVDYIKLVVVHHVPAPTKFVKEVGNYTTGTSGNPHVISISSAPTTGNHLVLVAIMAGGRTLTSVTDTQGNTRQSHQTLPNTT